MDWRPSISFCFITNGAKPAKLATSIESAIALNIPDFEIIVSGRPPEEPQFPMCRNVFCPDAADNGLLGALRNAACQAATKELLVVADDDMVFLPDFYEGLRRFGSDFDLAGCRILNTDDSRFWDYAVATSEKGQHLLPYDEPSDEFYVTGGLSILRARLFQQLQWNEGLGFYQAEDVEFTKRVREAGMRVCFNRYSSVRHNDDAYTQIGDRIERLIEPYEWYRIAPNVCARGLFRRAGNGFTVGKFFDVRVDPSSFSRKVSFEAMGYVCPDAYTHWPPKMSVSIDGKRVGEVPFPNEQNALGTQFELLPGQTRIFIEFDSVAVPAAFGVFERFCIGAFLRNFVVEGESREAMNEPSPEYADETLLIGPFCDGSEVGLALRETLLESAGGEQRFRMSSISGSVTAMEGDEVRVRNQLALCPPGIDVPSHSVAFLREGLLVGANVFRPQPNRWRRSTVFVPASIVDGVLLEEAQAGRIVIGVHSIDDAQAAAERGVPLEQLTVLDMLPVPTSLPIVQAVNGVPRVFSNMNWGGVPDPERFVRNIASSGPDVEHVVWVPDLSTAEEVRSYSRANGIEAERFLTLIGDLSRQELTSLIASSRIVVSWNETDSIGYFVRRCLAQGIPVIGNRIGKRKELKMDVGFIEAHQEERLGELILEALQNWDVLHEKCLRYRTELTQSPTTYELFSLILTDSRRE